MSYGNTDFDERMPVYEFTERGVQNVRPSSYFRNAQADMNQYGGRNRIGYVVRNLHGENRLMTFAQYHRMQDLFERNLLTIVDFWQENYMQKEYALAGCDTEHTYAMTQR